jgi:xanthine dehydrogenase YagR molybdenum-binding subunit
MGAATWFVGDGRPPATVILSLYPDGTANLNMGASDIGTGTKTVMAMVVAEELGLDPDSIQIEHADTGTTRYASPSGGSKTVPTEAPAVRRLVLDAPHAAASVLGRLLEYLPNPPVNRDFAELMRSDKVAEAGLPTLELLGVAPRTLESWLAEQARRGD